MIFIGECNRKVIKRITEPQIYVNTIYSSLTYINTMYEAIKIPYVILTSENATRHDQAHSNCFSNRS